MARLKGPWQTRVNFAPDGVFAYRPGEVLVREADAEDAQRIIWEVHKASTLELGPTAGEIAEEHLRLLRDAVGDEKDLGPFEEFIRILAEPPPGAGR
ncbi:MAG: hypothetical protein RI637_10815, partial [Acidimicrobiia bacterium]|nr:hypothetical protein [Acidimicrobiia bacterium]